LWAPGTRYEYSNANYLVLGRLIEVTSGTPFGAYLDRHIFRPLAMADATTDVPRADATGLTQAHRLWFGAPREVAPLVRPDLAPAGFVMASATDLGRFVAAQVNDGVLGGSRILSRSSVAEMGRGSVDTDAGDGSRYGLGWVETTVGGIRVVGHAGSTTDMASVAYFAPERRNGIVLLLNGQSTLYEVAHKPDLIGLAAFELLQGREPDGTLAALYPAFDMLCLAVIGYLVWRFGRVVRDARRRALAPPRPWGRRSVGIAWTVWLGLVLPVEILIAMPRLLGAPWTTLIRIDVGLVAFLVVSLRLAIGAVYLAAAVRGSWSPDRARRTSVVSVADGE
jgi:CubicO group peptidase (beta-lactamase class C family)